MLPFHSLLYFRADPYCHTKIHILVIFHYVWLRLTCNLSYRVFSYRTCNILYRTFDINENLIQQSPPFSLMAILMVPLSSCSFLSLPLWHQWQREFPLILSLSLISCCSYNAWSHITISLSWIHCYLLPLSICLWLCFSCHQFFIFLPFVVAYDLWLKMFSCAQSPPFKDTPLCGIQNISWSLVHTNH